MRDDHAGAQASCGGAGGHQSLAEFCRLGFLLFRCNRSVELLGNKEYKMAINLVTFLSLFKNEKRRSQNGFTECECIRLTCLFVIVLEQPMTWPDGSYPSIFSPSSFAPVHSLLSLRATLWPQVLSTKNVRVPHQLSQVYFITLRTFSRKSVEGKIMVFTVWAANFRC